MFGSFISWPTAGATIVCKDQTVFRFGEVKLTPGGISKPEMMDVCSVYRASPITVTFSSSQRPSLHTDGQNRHLSHAFIDDRVQIRQILGLGKGDGVIL